jgi:hypothetical protein
MVTIILAVTPRYVPDTTHPNTMLPTYALLANDEEEGRISESDGQAKMHPQ